MLRDSSALVSSRGGDPRLSLLDPCLRRGSSTGVPLYSDDVFEGSSPLFVAMVPRYIACGKVFPKYGPEQPIAKTCESSAAVRAALLQICHQLHRLQLGHHTVPTPPGAGLQQSSHDRRVISHGRERVPRRLRLASANQAARLSTLWLHLPLSQPTQSPHATISLVQRTIAPRTLHATQINNNNMENVY